MAKKTVELTALQHVVMAAVRRNGTLSRHQLVPRLHTLGFRNLPPIGPMLDELVKIGLLNRGAQLRGRASATPVWSVRRGVHQQRGGKKSFVWVLPARGAPKGRAG